LQFRTLVNASHHHQLILSTVDWLEPGAQLKNTMNSNSAAHVARSISEDELTREMANPGPGWLFVYVYKDCTVAASHRRRPATLSAGAVRPCLHCHPASKLAAMSSDLEWLLLRVCCRLCIEMLFVDYIQLTYFYPRISCRKTARSL
jgi:hypothetical protein